MPKVFLSTLLFTLTAIFPVKVHASEVKINEFSAHPSAGNQEWVEFYNPDGIELTSYYLDDDTDFASDSGNTSKKSLSSINTSSSTYPYLEYSSSFLNNSGDYVVLFTQDGTIVDQYQYVDDPGDDVSIGRSPDGSGSFDILASQTKGFANSQPQPDPSPTPTTSSTNQSSSSKSPSPTPKTVSPSSQNAKSASKVSPSPKTILGEKVQSQEIFASNSALEINYTSPSPTPVLLEDNKPQIPKMELTLAGSGIIVLGLSAVAYLWYRRKLQNTKGDSKDEEL